MARSGVARSGVERSVIVVIVIVFVIVFFLTRGHTGKSSLIHLEKFNFQFNLI